MTTLVLFLIGVTLVAVLFSVIACDAASQARRDVETEAAERLKIDARLTRLEVEVHQRHRAAAEERRLNRQVRTERAYGLRPLDGGKA